MGRPMRHFVSRVGVGAVLAGLLAGMVIAFAGTAQASVNITGTWRCCGAGGAGAQEFVITTGTGSLAGKGITPSGSGFAKITGNLTGNNVTIVTTYTGGSYVATFKGTVSADGKTMTGTWSAEKGAQTGTWTATLVSAASTPTPVLGQSVAASTVSGQVLVEKPGTTTYVPLSSAGTLPVGTIVNATNGRIALTAAGSGKTRHKGQFYGGEFKLGQAHSGLTNLTLTGGTPCAGSAAATAHHRPAARKAQLWGTGHGGDFETTGTYAAGTVLGTRWLTKDTCTATVIRVLEGEVRIHNLVTNSTVVVHAPGSYTARS
jgi:hypothetical protein